MKRMNATMKVTLFASMRRETALVAGGDLRGLRSAVAQLPLTHSKMTMLVDGGHPNGHGSPADAQQVGRGDRDHLAVDHDGDEQHVVVLAASAPSPRPSSG